MRSFVSCVLALAAAPAFAPAADLKDFQQKGVLRALVSADEQPEMFAVTNDAPPGFERELLEGFAKTRNLKVAVVMVHDFEQIIPALLKGDGDLIVGIVDTASRRKQIDFTIETLPARHLAISRKPGAPVRTLDDLRAAHMVLATGTSWAEAAFAAGVKPGSALMVPDLPGVLAALQAGRAGATVMSAPDFALAQRRDPALEAGVFIGAPTPAAWGMRKADAALTAAINDYIFTMRSTPAWSQLVTKYFNGEALELFRRARKP